ncbi:MAG: hypothetical protein ACKOWH_03335 [Rhodoluna sp.]
MRNKIITPSTSLREAYLNAAGPTTFSTRVLALFALPAFGVVLVNNPIRLGGSFSLWLALATIAYAATIIPMLVFKRLIYPVGETAPKPLLTSLALVISGLIRGLTFYYLGVFWGLIPESEIFYRIWGAVIFVYASIAVFSIYRASGDRHELVLVQLAQEKAQLDELRGGIRERIRAQRAELLAKVQQQLTPVVDRLKAELNISASNVLVANLRDAVEHVVRPLSRDLGTTTVAVVGARIEKDISRLARQRSKIPSRVPVGLMFVAPLLVFMVAAISVTANSIFSPEISTLASLITLGVAFVIPLAARYLLANWQLPTAWAFIVVSAVMVAMAFLTDAVLSLIGAGRDIAQLTQYTIYVVFCGALIFALQILRTQRNALELEMKNVVAELALLNSQLRQEIWLNRKRIASVLHGPIQAALYAAAIRLNKAEVVEPELIQSIESDISAAMYQLEQGESADDFESILSQIQNVWTGATDIQIDVADSEIFSSLRANSIASTCAAEVVREAVSNAVKHGQAANISVRLERSAPNLLAIKVTNDGLPLGDAVRMGYGSHILDEVAFNWSLENKAGFTVLSADIAL